MEKVFHPKKTLSDIQVLQYGSNISPVGFRDTEAKSLTWSMNWALALHRWWREGEREKAFFIYDLSDSGNDARCHTHVLIYIWKQICSGLKWLTYPVCWLVCLFPVRGLILYCRDYPCFPHLLLIHIFTIIPSHHHHHSTTLPPSPPPFRKE